MWACHPLHQIWARALCSALSGQQGGGGCSCVVRSLHPPVDVRSATALLVQEWRAIGSARDCPKLKLKPIWKDGSDESESDIEKRVGDSSCDVSESVDGKGDDEMGHLSSADDSDESSEMST